MEILADVSDFVHENQMYILEGVELQNTNVMVARAVVTPGVSVPVRVMNPTDQPVTLYNGTRIAHLTEVEEVDDGSMLISSVQCNGDISSELEAALWTLAEQASLKPEEQERLFILLVEYADVFALIMICWVELIFFNMRFIQEMLHQFANTFIEYVLRRDKK